MFRWFVPDRLRHVTQVTQVTYADFLKGTACGLAPASGYRVVTVQSRFWLGTTLILSFCSLHQLIYGSDQLMRINRLA